MGREALLDSMRRKAADERQAVWREAHAAADTYRTELAQVLDAERLQTDRSVADLARVLASNAEAEGSRRARTTRAQAALELAERCRQLASEELPRLRTEGGPDLFLALASELPALRWQRVLVNPGDTNLARASFPQAEVACDPAISGGLAVEAEDGRIRVTNTLETRLRTAWPDIVPRLIGELLPGARDDATTT